MGLSTLFSNLSIVIVVALLVVSVAMFFYFRQKISELEKASLNQAKVLQSFISRMFAMPPPPNYNQLPPTEVERNEPSYELTQTNKKEKIQVSDDEEEYSSDESTDSDSDDDSSSRSSDTTLEDNDESNLKLVKLQELDEFDVETLERQNVKKISLQHLVDDNIDLQPLELHDATSLDGSCDDESLSELSDEDDDDESIPDTDNNVPSKINVVKQQELKVESEEAHNIQTDLSVVLNKLSSEHVDIQVDVSNIDIVKKANNHNTSLKDKSNELSNLKVDTLRQLVVDKSLASSDEVKKLKKKELLVMLEEKPTI
jgi:hypothetical protein